MSELQLGSAMSLERYCHERCIALSPRESAYVAARAMGSNHIGSIVVYHRGRVVGMVTDRDLALRVVGERRGFDVPLEEVMTSLPATLSIDDDIDEAIDLMRDLSVRRIPVLDGERLVGMVTVDDLLVSRDVALEPIAGVVEAQLAEQAPGKPAGAVHPIRTARGPVGDEDRRRARREETLRRFKERLCALLEVPERDDALRAFEVFAGGLVRRLPAREAEAFVSQLPVIVQEHLLDLPAGPDRSVTPDAVAREMARRLDLDLDLANHLLPRLGAALGALIDEGDLGHVRDHLPRDWKPLLQPTMHA